MLVTHAIMKGLGLTPLFKDRRGFMPPQLKTNKIPEGKSNYLLSQWIILSETVFSFLKVVEPPKN